jgi:hypothetical protein
MNQRTGLLNITILAFAVILTLSSASYGSTALDACLLKAISNARDDTSVGKLRQGCANSSNVTIKEQPIKKTDTPVYELSAVDERFNA